MRPVTLVMAYYANPGMLAEHYRLWASYPGELKAQLSVVVVDDGSPSGPALDVPRPDGLPALRILRMGEDIRWGQDAARNRGVDQATSKWVLMTDMDHLLPAETLARVAGGQLRCENVYRFGRVSAPDLTPYKPHPNSWLMTRGMFDAIGGYDERYLGFYGSDGPFRSTVEAAVAAAGGEIVLLEEHLVRIPREVVPDASTTQYGRKEAQDREGVKRIKSEIAALPAPDRRPVRRNLAWERVF